MGVGVVKGNTAFFIAELGCGGTGLWLARANGAQTKSPSR